MSNSKKDFEIINKIILDLIISLSVTEYENIIRGTATLKYVEKDLPPSKRVLFQQILNKLVYVNTFEDIQSLLKENPTLKTKTDLIDFCSFLNIGTKSKDTINEIIFKICNFIEYNKESLLYSITKVNETSTNIEIVAEELEKFMNVQDAQEFLKNNEVLTNKSSLIKLAKELDVYIEKDATYSELIETIVDSVVGSKLRSLSIRKKI
ncbi:hypothetical protein [Brevibacillus laterosporus]|uniref:hypothetical protein n=1 Tax=Brevibacillus laterosporus TaxID=1465 RepID=UPI000EAEFE26|nr:hypothetical protein [Brevibacillus laterosporus]AYK05656.1 hypothetical protein D8Z77_04140 [Brevibacillus laterosporus]